MRPRWLVGTGVLLVALSGCQGADGTQGPQGPPGEQGEQGEQGPPGADGTVNIANVDGLVEALANNPEFLSAMARRLAVEESLRGPQGMTGPRGEQGEQGPQGPEGDCRCPRTDRDGVCLPFCITDEDCPGSVDRYECIDGACVDLGCNSNAQCGTGFECVLPDN